MHVWLLSIALAVVSSAWQAALAADIAKCEAVANGSAEVLDIHAALDDGRTVTLKGILTRPSIEDPVPAVIMLAGDGSLTPPYCHGALARQFVSWGYAALILASSTASDGEGTRLYQYSFRDQANHARGAAVALGAMANIDSGRIAVWGHSRGGLTALELALHPRGDSRLFRAIISAAPHCPAKFDALRRPLLLIVGSGDVVVSVQACREFADRMAAGAGFEFLLLPDARHLFWLEPDAAQVSAQHMRRFLDAHVLR